MANLFDIMLYFCKNYPNKSDLSKTRLTKLVYLADWRSAITNNRQITDIEWFFDHYGPYVDDIIEKANKKTAFKLKNTRNMYGSSKTVIVCEGDVEPDLSDEEKGILDHVIENTRDLNFNNFVQLVYSTYPILSKEKYEKLDLVSLAKEYNKQKHLLEA